MSTLNDNYKRIMSEIEQKVTSKEELEFVKEKIEELSVMFLNIIDELSLKTEARIKKIEEKQNIIEKKVSNVERAVDEIESDFYEADEISQDEGSFEFEIVCPYCNDKFIEELNYEESQEINEIECPECHNIIELDWDEDNKEEQNIDNKNNDKDDDM